MYGIKNADLKPRIRISLALILLASLAIEGVSAASTATTDTSTDAAATNMVVDFTSTSLDASVMPGDSSVLNLVIKNTGGRSAENVQVWITSTSTVRADKRFYVGRMDAGESKAIPVIISVPEDAKTGLSAMQVRINFDGYKSDGTVNNNQLTTWEIPLTIIGNPVFQLAARKTTYSRDTLDELALEVTSKDRIKDAAATISSNCFSVIGPSNKYVGDIGANQAFNLAYQIKPTASGACPASVRISYTDESGTKTSENQTLGLMVEDAGVDIKVAKVSYTPTGPGQRTDLTILLRNVGGADAAKVTAHLNISSPFAPVETSEVYLPQVKAGEEVEIGYKLAVGWDATTQVYSIPLTISYQVGGTSYSVGKDIGVDVAGNVVLEVMDVQSSNSNIRIDVANIGTRAAEGVKATLIVPNTVSSQGQGQGRNFTGGRRSGGDNLSQVAGQGGDVQRLISYKSDIKSTKQTTFTFPTSATGSATLLLEYSGLNNERVTQTERITLPTSGGTTGSRYSSSSSNSTYYYLLAAAAVIIAYLAYRRYKQKKK